MSTPYEYTQVYQSLVIRLSACKEGNATFAEEEALLYNEACRYLAAVAKTFRLNQEAYNKTIEDKENNDDDDPGDSGERPTRV